MGGLASSLSISELQKLLHELLDRDGADYPVPPESALLSREPLQLRCLAFLFHELYGAVDVRRTKIQQLLRQCAMFAESYGDGPVEVLRVPARINVLGEHVDYVSYLPTASLTLGSRENDMVILFRRAENRRIRGMSTLPGSDPIIIDLSEAPPPGAGSAWESYLYSRAAPPAHWGNYVRGAAFYACMRFGERVRHGFDFAVDSSIPPAGGASSSSALTVLAGAALRAVNHIRYDPAELARDSSRAEWFIGTRGGSMDHTTMCVAQRMHAVHISYADDRFDLVPMKFPQVRWLTFFSHPANKGNELMLEYNERAAVSRLIIPALIAADHERHAAWNAAVNAQRLGSVTALDELETLARLLPEAINFAKLEESNPGTFAQCRMSFPVLLRDRAAKPVKVRDRALHHLGEVRRIAAAASVLRAAAGNEDGPDEQSVLGHLGRLLRESHASLRDLYEVSTPEVEELVHLVLSDPTVYGARLMGGGFGGNVLALTTSAHSARVIERIQELFYRPRGRDGRAERAVMVSTPGDGLSGLDCAGAARAAVGNLNHAGRDPGAQRSAVCRLLDELGGESHDREFWPIIVAAGKGARARATGIAVPKPLVPVSGVPSVLRVLEAVYASHFALRRPIIVASPETEPALRQLLPPDGAEFAIQPRALGTGDAVLCAAQAMRDFDGLALVVWGTQPVIRAQTVRRSLTLAALYPEYEMIVPTAIVEKPYAPLLRNSSGAVCGSRETHLEQARSLEHGETNVGLFVAASGAMLEALSELKRAYWRESEGRYDRPGGELGFPNELITLFSRRACGVLACPIADPREQRGVKTLEDIAVCERYIRELSTLEGN